MKLDRETPQPDFFNTITRREERAMPRQPVPRPESHLDLVNQQFIHGAIKMLEKAGAVFRIEDRYGASYGTLVLPEPKKLRKPRVSRYKRGELINFYMPYLEKDTPVGGQFYVPVGEYPAEHIRSALCSTLSGLWGLKSYTTHIDDGLVLVTRLS